jgi:hypothetical protein
MNKFDKFWEADKVAGNITAEVRGKFAKYGTFEIDNADIILQVSAFEKCPPELLAVTWMNETTFRFYSEPNKNGLDFDFNAWDVGPFQMNVGILHANLNNRYLSSIGLTLLDITGTDEDMFNGDPVQNAHMAARHLMRGGSQNIVAGKERYVMFPSLTFREWADLPEDEKNLRRAVAFTGPEARPARAESFKKFGPMFKKFFEEYSRG